MFTSHQNSTEPTARRPRSGAASDDRLVAAVRAGSEPAFAAIVERYEQQLVAYARKTLGGRHHDAEDCVQDAFVNALRALRANADAEIALKPWLHAIVRNRCIDHLRRPVRNTAIDNHGYHLAGNGPGPASQIANADAVRMIVDGIAALPERQRQALVMHELEQRSHTAIGRMLGVTPGASKALVCRARRGVAAVRPLS